MLIDWTTLAGDLGSLYDKGEQGGTDYALRALERIVGEDGIQSAVELILSWGRGSEVATNVLELLHSRHALLLAYAAYKRASSAEEAQRAVWLIKMIHHPQALQWMEEFLADERVAGVGIDVLDQLLFTQMVTPEEVEDLLALGSQHGDAEVRETVATIRYYLARRDCLDTLDTALAKVANYIALRPAKT